MTRKLSLKEAERQAWALHLRDGLWDILLGMLLLGTAIRTVADNLWWYLLLVVAVPIYLAGRRFITIPRMGRVEFGLPRKRKQRKTMVVLGAAVLATLVLWGLAVSWKVPSGSVGSTMLVVATIVVLGATAYWSDLKRLYVYGLLLGGAIALTEFVGEPIGPIAFCVSGAVPLLVGFVMLIRFLVEYPIPPEELPDQEGLSGNC